MLWRSAGDVQDIAGSVIYRAQGPSAEKPTDTKVTLVKTTQEVIVEILPTEPKGKVEGPSVEEGLTRLTGR